MCLPVSRPAFRGSTSSRPDGAGASPTRGQGCGALGKQGGLGDADDDPGVVRMSSSTARRSSAGSVPGTQIPDPKPSLHKSLPRRRRCPRRGPSRGSSSCSTSTQSPSGPGGCSPPSRPACGTSGRTDALGVSVRQVPPMPPVPTQAASPFPLIVGCSLARPENAEREDLTPFPGSPGRAGAPPRRRPAGAATRLTWWCRRGVDRGRTGRDHVTSVVDRRALSP